MYFVQPIRFTPCIGTLDKLLNLHPIEALAKNLTKSHAACAPPSALRCCCRLPSCQRVAPLLLCLSTALVPTCCPLLLLLLQSLKLLGEVSEEQSCCALQLAAQVNFRLDKGQACADAYDKLKAAGQVRFLGS